MTTRPSTACFSLLLLVACAPGELGAPAPEDDQLTSELSTPLTVGEEARVCGASSLNQRTGPSTAYDILRAMPSGSRVTILAAQNGWYRNDWDGRVGWSSGMYLCAAGASDPGASLGSFQLTYYWVPSEDDYGGSDAYRIYSLSCGVIATVPSAFRSAIALEGTGRLEDGRIVNYAGGCDCGYSPCFRTTSAPWGLGANGRELTPFRSVAVDPDLIAIGTRLYSPALDGRRMPGDAPWGGFVHDGCLTADDVGGAVNGKHVDFFAAERSAYLDLDSELPSTLTLYRGAGRCGP